ncbi:polymeric immunoglobulin receptor-like [Hoplias malabaricus]|uniref:polymeric immunoglobulin receptor-like n=1 Tax=Hoplias malabaricus TaxID=27720 RepID=UPI003462804B
MKTLLIFTFFLISGPVGCFDVIGYSGGSVMIFCKYKHNGVFTKYFCETTEDETQRKCISQNYLNNWSHEGRLSLFNFPGGLLMIFRNLSLQDSGSYECGEAGVWNHEVELKVKRDPCCSGPSAVTGFLGETLTINCSSPEEFKTSIKSFYKQDGEDITEVISTIDSQRNRFSISEDESSKFVRVRISEVREEDRGVRYCAVGVGGESVSYSSFYTEILLQVRESSVIITIEINNPPGNQMNFGMNPVNQNTQLKITQSDSVYQNPNLRSIKPDSHYQSMNPKTNQSDAVYNTNQSDSVYWSLNPNTKQSDSVYQSLDPNTNQSDSIYQSLDINTN